MPHRAATIAVTIAAILVARLAAPLGAAEFDDPTWPCIQPKVEELSVALMWPQPIAGTAPAPEIATEIDDLVDRLVLRRVGIEAAQDLVAAFAARAAPDLETMGIVFERAFTRLARDRRAIMAGITDYSRKQIGLSQRIEAARDEMSAQMQTDAPDFDRVDALEEQIDWDERIYTDRQRSLTYVCETPVLLEKRLYAIAQMLQQNAAD